MVSERDFKKQIKEAYREERPSLRIYAVALIVMVLVAVVFVIFSSAPAEREITVVTSKEESLIVDKKIGRDVQDSKIIIGGLQDSLENTPGA